MMTNWFKPLYLVIVAAFLAVFLWTAHSVFVLDNGAIYAENGPLEALQVVTLAVSCLVFLVPVVLKNNQQKLILLSCALLCYSFVVRELDVEQLNVPNAIKFIGSGVGRNTSLTVGFSMLLVYVVVNHGYYKKAILLFLRSKSGILLMAGGLLLAGGDVFEKRYSMLHHVFYEEILELSGYVFILLGAIAANYGFTRRTPLKRCH